LGISEATESVLWHTAILVSVLQKILMH